jgi:hypothetical protein
VAASQARYDQRVHGRKFRRKVQQMKKTAIWFILVALEQISSTSRAQSQEDFAKQLAGMWRLVSNPQRLLDGTTREGSNNVGYAFFDANVSHMCFLSMNPNRPQWKSETTPTPEEGLSAIKGFGAYCATIEVHAKEGFMIRHYEINQTPNAVGRATKRWYTFQGPDRMSLRVDASELNRPVVENTFVWERVK